jgi:lipid-A-disaccharide synthase
MMVAVEPSADSLGAALARTLRARLGGSLRLIGVGGPKLAAEGLVSAFDPSALAVVGAFNALFAYPEVLRGARRLGELVRAERPDVAILIDAWGFNLRVARALRAADPRLPLIKYVAPQVWATRPGRARTLARAVDHLLTIHSFDAGYFEREGLATTFVGNPVLDRDFSSADPSRFRDSIGAGPNTPILLLLPGSRLGEIERLLPAFQAAVDRLKSERPDLRLVIGVADSVADRVALKLREWRHEPVVVRSESGRLDAMRAATVALACSGTVTTELALAGCPMVVAYRLDPITHLIAKRLIRTPYITLFNVAVGAFVAPERVQYACNGPQLAADISRLLDNPDIRTRQIGAQSAALGVMRGGIASPIDAAADAVIGIMRRRRV